MHLLPVEDREIISYLEEIRDRLERLGYLKRYKTQEGEILESSFENYSLKVERNFCKKYVNFRMNAGKMPLCEIFVNVSLELVPTVFIRPVYHLRTEILIDRLRSLLKRLEKMETTVG
jgi:hypothetical protein